MYRVKVAMSIMLLGMYHCQQATTEAGLQVSFIKFHEVVPVI